jgi:hypothetical protein
LVTKLNRAGGLKEKMNRKRTLSTTMLLLLAFSVLSVLRFNLVRVSAVPVSPYIMVKPEKTLNSTYTVGSNYTVSVYTNYNTSLGSDAYTWQFSLTFNSSILEGLQVRNGDLITTAKHSSATFAPGTFDNTIGKLSLTIAYFYHTSPPPFRTSGPGTLANVTFRVKGYGISDIHISDTAADPPTMLGGYNIAKGGYYEIIDGTLESEKLGHGFFSNKLIGDIDGDRDVDVLDLFILGRSYGSLAGQPKYKRVCDLDLDGDVDGIDLGMFPPNYGKNI